MRETAGSLRVYFVLVGVLGGASNLSNLVRAPWSIRSIGSALGVVLACALVYAGIKLNDLLVSTPARLEQLVIAEMAVSVLNVVLVALLFRPAFAQVALSLVVSVAIGLYLLSAIRRLAADAVAAPTPVNAQAEPGPAATWHTDPTTRHELRYWNGSAWTEHVSDAGVVATDPI